jgi:hypothetical protein
MNPDSSQKCYLENKLTDIKYFADYFFIPLCSLIIFMAFFTTIILICGYISQKFVSTNTNPIKLINEEVV